MQWLVTTHCSMYYDSQFASSFFFTYCLVKLSVKNTKILTLKLLNRNWDSFYRQDSVRLIWHVSNVRLNHFPTKFFTVLYKVYSYEGIILNNIFQKLWILNNVFCWKFKILAFYESDLQFRNIWNFFNKYKQEMEWIVTNFRIY